MSMILDALQRADRERRKEATPPPTLLDSEPLATPVTSPTPGQNLRWVVIVAVVAGLLAGGLIARWLLTTAPPAEPATTVTEPATTAEEPQAEAPATSRQPAIERLYQAPAGAAPSTESIATLYRQAQQPRARAANPEPQENTVQRVAARPASASVSLNEPATTTNTLGEAPSATNEPSEIREPSASPEPRPDVEEAPTLPGVPSVRDLSWNLQQEIPTLNYQGHQYQEGSASANRVTINQREYREGSQIGSQLRVERIEEDGVVLSFKGQKFKLQALNSWINM